MALCGLVWIQASLLQKTYNQTQDVFDRNVKVVMQNVIHTFFVESLKTGVTEIIDTTIGDKRNVHIELIGRTDGEKGAYTTNVDHRVTIRQDVDRSEAIGVFSDSVGDQFTGDKWANKLVRELISNVSESHWEDKIKSYDFDSSITSNLESLDLPEKFEYVVLDDNGELVVGSQDFDKSGTVYEKEMMYGNVFPSGMLRLKIPTRNYSIFSSILMPISLSTLFLLLAAGLFIYLFGLYRKEKSVSEARDDFINSMSHELKTPLATIALSLENLKFNDPENHNYVSIVKEENERMQYYVENILQLARMDKTEFEVHQRHVDVVDLLEKLIEKYRIHARRKGGEIYFDQYKELVIPIDPMHMRNVIGNLLDNAIRYSDQSPEVQVKLRQEQHHLAIEVSDNGRGIPPEAQQKVFEKFFRVQSGNLYDAKGTGIGLSYVKHIVELHNGSVRLRSEPNEGSTFTIELPYG